MAFHRFSDRSILVGAILLALAGAGAWWAASAQIESTRRNLVEKRLWTAVEILRAPATEALASPDQKEAFLAHLRDWGSVTGLRLTLILGDGSVLADTEVEANMPNLADRPEVRAAAEGLHKSEFRRSVVTGKDTLYVATKLEKDGRRIGTIRAATDASEVDAALGGIESTFVILALSCLGLGTVLGLVVARSWTRRQEPVAGQEAFERLAA